MFNVYADKYLFIPIIFIAFFQKNEENGKIITQPRIFLSRFFQVNFRGEDDITK